MSRRAVYFALAAAAAAAALAYFLLFADRPPEAPVARPEAAAVPAPEAKRPAPTVEAAERREATPPSPPAALARLSIEVRDGNGLPLDGIEVELLPPIVAGDDWTANWRTESEGPRPVVDPLTGATRRTVTAPRRFDRGAMGALGTDDWIRTSGADGRVAWSGLHPGTGYRFGIRSNAAGFVRLEPPHEAERPPHGLSGRFSIAPGAETECAATLFAPATVRATLVAENGEPAPGVAVRLVRLALRERSDGEDEEKEVLRRDEAAATSAESGAIEFTGVDPGRKELAAFFEKPRGHFHCVSLPFEIAPGEALDLGNVGTAGRHSIEGMVRFVGERGEPLAAADLFEPSDAPVMHGIAMANAGFEDDAGEEGPFPPPHALRIEVEAERPFFIHGLAEGRFDSGPPHAVGPRATPIGQVRFEGRGSKGIAVPGDGRFELVIDTRPYAIASLLVDVPPDAAPQRVTAHFLPADGGPRVEIEWTATDGGATSNRVALKPGRHRYLVHSEPAARRDEGASYWAEGEFDVAHEAEVRAGMRLAASVAGVVRRDESEFGQTESVALGFAPWIDAAGDGWPYRAALDRRGRFAVRGLPPHRSVAIRGATQPIETGAPGEEREVAVSIP